MLLWLSTHLGIRTVLEQYSVIGLVAIYYYKTELDSHKFVSLFSLFKIWRFM